MRRALRRAGVLLVAVAAASVGAARAQAPAQTPQQAQQALPEGTLVAPGQMIAPELALASGGPIGREVAPLLGREPLLLVYWRPRDGQGEKALARAAKLAPAGVRFLQVAVIAQNQPESDIAERLAANGVTGQPPRQDPGHFGIMVGVDAMPSFVLIDATGVLRAVGGTDITHNAAIGTTILEAATLAAKKQPVPTLGFIKPSRAYRLLDAPLPGIGVGEFGSADERPLEQLLAPKRRTLLVYWAPQCTHCREALPKLAAWYPHRPADLDVIDIARGDAPAQIDEAAKFASAFPWTHVVDRQRFGSLRLQVSETPTAFVIEPDQTISAVHTGGGIDWAKWLGSR